MKLHQLKLKSYAFVLLFMFSLFGCSNNEEKYPKVEPQGKEQWLMRMNNDIVSLKNAVLAVIDKDSVTNISISDNSYNLEFLEHDPVTFVLDNAAASAPLIGIHKIDNDYFWTSINGTGTSATVLLKDKNRNNYQVKNDGVLPKLDINEYGHWNLLVDGERRQVYDAEGKPFRAIGEKALFQSIKFDVDSNAVIMTNEVPPREYTLPKYQPCTLVLSVSDKDTLKVASGFAIPIDFFSSAIESFDFSVPRSWNVSYTMNSDLKGGNILITSPLGIEENYENKGTIKIFAKSIYGKVLERTIPVKCEIGLVNYANISISDVPSDINLQSAVFTFSKDFTSKDTKNVTSVKAGSNFRLMLPDGYPILRSITFTTSGVEINNQFTYYYPQNTILKIGDQKLSIAPPKELSYWQGGLLLKVDNKESNSGIGVYRITGTIMAMQIGPKIPWYPNSSADIKEANSDDDGAANTAAIINLFGPAKPDGSNLNIAARWATWVSDGGYNDWYLPAANEMMIFNNLWIADTDAFKDKVLSYGGIPVDETKYKTYWTSTNINNEKAKMYDIRYHKISTGTKIYGCYNLSFRKVSK